MLIKDSAISGNLLTSVGNIDFNDFNFFGKNPITLFYLLKKAY